MKQLVIITTFFWSALSVAENPPGSLPYWSPNSIHEYADAAACENGGGETKYLPRGVKPTAPEAKDIPREWAGKPITWDNTAKVWLIGGQRTRKGVCSDPTIPTKLGCLNAGRTWTPGWPEDETTVSNAANTRGTNLKCDRWEAAGDSCVPHHKLYMKDVDGIRWAAIFRRTEAPMYSGPVAGMTTTTSTSNQWNNRHTAVYWNIDVGGYNLTTRAGTWLDTVRKGGSGPNPDIQDNRYDIGFLMDPKNNFPGNDGALPRPGGLRPWARNEGARASRFYDSAEAMNTTQRCTACHTSFFNGSDSLAKTNYPLGTYDDQTYWHAGNDVLNFPELQFFNAASHRDDPNSNITACTQCHTHFARNDADAQMLYYRLQYLDFMTGKPETFMRQFASDWRLANKNSQGALIPVAARNPRRTHAMPGDHQFSTTGEGTCTNPNLKSYVSCLAGGARWSVYSGPTPLQGPASTWVFHNQPAVEMIKCCMGSDAPGCDRVVCDYKRPAIPKFFIPEDEAKLTAAHAWPPREEYQVIRAPDSVSALGLTMIDCPLPRPSGFVTGDKCYKLRWEDSTGSPFNAPRKFYWNNPSEFNGFIRSANAPDWTADEKLPWEFCPGGSTREVPITSQSQLTNLPVGERWRFAYESIGLLKSCTKIGIQFCGGWCASDKTSNRPATNRGAFLSVVNSSGCAPTTSTLTVQISGSGTGLVTSSPAGVHCDRNCTATFARNAQVTLTATPAAGSRFSGWGGACSGTNTTCTVSMAASRTVTANFDVSGSYLLKVNVRGNGVVISDLEGIICGLACEKTYAEGTRVTLTAVPATGERFLGWSGGGCAGTATTCTITLNASVIVKADFSGTVPSPTPTPTPSASPGFGRKR